MKKLPHLFLFSLVFRLALPAQSTRTPIERLDSISNEVFSSSWNLSGVLLSKGLVFRVRGLSFSENAKAFASESIPVLDSLADFLRLNPSIRLKISVHFSEDVPASTLKQSKIQSQTILKYLASRRINPKRLKVAVWGNAYPLYPESLLRELQSPELQSHFRALNNRVDFEITANLN